ncbi:MAG: hypothetical protein K2H46_10480 [Muribaculaceae bacterium]|nr:hypothetical protein [Muribaculaceae bacterium]
MPEQEEIKLFAKITNGLKLSYESLLHRKAALGQDMVIADTNGQPIVVSAKELLARRTDSDNCKCSNK